MSSKTERMLKTFCLMMIAGGVLFIASRIFLNPDQFSRNMLKVGGRLIKKATSHVGEVAFVGGSLVVISWGIIAILSYRESQKQNDSTS